MPVPKKLKKIKIEGKIDHNTKRTLCRIGDVDDMDELIELTKSDNPHIRLKALQRMCPCHNIENIEKFWERMFEMVDDEELGIRKQVLHNLCDGSPAEYEVQVMDAVMVLSRDKDKDLRRMCNKIIASYRATGEWNIM